MDRVHDAKHSSDLHFADFLSLKTLLPAYVFLVALGAFSRFGVESILWLSVYGLAAFYLIFKTPNIIASLIASWLVLLPPLIALLSVFWSVDPKHSLIAAIQFLITTLIAVWIGSSFSNKQIFNGLFLAMGVAILASLLNSAVEFIPAYSGHGELIGIFAQKNIMGRAIVMGVIALFVVGFRLGLSSLAVLLALVLLIPMAAAESASSLVVHLLVLTIPVVYLVATAKDGMRTTVLFFAFGGGLFLIGLLAVVDIDLVNQFLNKLGKDSSLTGRTVLWAVAWEMIEWKPLLGVGYDAFWSVDAFSDLMRTIQAQGETINGFHNAYLEAMVSTGLFGGLAFISSILMTIYLVFRGFFSDLSIENLGAIYVVVAIVIFSFFDIVMYREHDINHMLVVILFVSSQRNGQDGTVDHSNKALDAG